MFGTVAARMCKHMHIYGCRFVQHHYVASRRNGEWSVSIVVRELSYECLVMYKLGICGTVNRKWVLVAVGASKSRQVCLW